MAPISDSCLGESVRGFLRGVKRAVRGSALALGLCGAIAPATTSGASAHDLGEEAGEVDEFDVGSAGRLGPEVGREAGAAEEHQTGARHITARPEECAAVLDLPQGLGLEAGARRTSMAP